MGSEPYDGGGRIAQPPRIGAPDLLTGRALPALALPAEKCRGNAQCAAHPVLTGARCADRYHTHTGTPVHLTPPGRLLAVAVRVKEGTAHTILASPLVHI